ncbi:MAG: tyrosine-type recombinase/integrase [Candidatus Aminicenantes bacterium]
MGFEDAKIHTLRSNFAIHLIMNGVDSVTVKELLSHKDISTTMRYAHVVPNHKLWAVNRLCSISKVDAV